jgi:hypothetical protein
LDPDSLPEIYKNISRQGRPSDKYDDMYLRRVKANQFDDEAEYQARRPRKAKE